MQDKDALFPIVGIGASAGGIPAIESFFKGLPADPGVAFVVVTHLSPDRESMLDKVISHYTSLPVTIAADDVKVEPNHVYVLPANATITIAEGHLRLQPGQALHRERKPIDVFLGALAEDRGEHAVAVILSGGDVDGTLGAKLVKERGGLTLAQTAGDSGPQNPDMPQSAISTGMIDIAVPAERMGQKIADYARSFGALARLARVDGREQDAALEKARNEVYEIVRSQTGHDFSGYKLKTFMRRVMRRMQVLQLQSLDDYIEALRRVPSEVANLFRDLLINVTNFFRDTEAFDSLEALVVPQLFEGRAANDTIRIWVPGCATGEEVYSIAILMRERLELLPRPPRVQIFATDIDEPALAVARTGRYPEQLLDLLPDARPRFFVRQGASFVVSPEIRELCIFSAHSLVRDPPFSRMDLVSCRNLLIYFGPDIQKRVIPTFHYALRPGGFLFLGTSESISQYGELFSVVDKKHRIFQAREHASVPYRVPLLVREYGAGPQRLPEAIAPPAISPLRLTVEAQVIERHSPAHVVINPEGEIVYYSAKTGRYLEVPQGVPTRQILTLARKGLRLDLRAALQEALSKRATAVRSDVPLHDDRGYCHPVRITVEPLAERPRGEGLFLVLFEPSSPATTDLAGEKTTRAVEERAAHERENQELRERLQSTIEEYETVLEEVKSSNEELVSVNEEAQSANEELEASKEEMQALNEELSTVNAELSSKIEDLDRANSDLKNLFESTRIATVFLDRNLVIRNFTPMASSFFNLRAADVGRPLTELSNELHYPELKAHIQQVFASGQMVEHQLPRDGRGKHYLVRLVPYVGNGGGTDGVVVTLVDVSTLAEAEAHQQVMISELNHRVKNMLGVVISVANQTLAKGMAPNDFAKAFTGRLQAMARTHTVLARTSWKDASVAELVKQETEALGPQRFDTSGSHVSLKPEQALSLGMVIHELSTNAVKYGCLSNRDGAVRVRWSVNGRQFALSWEEKGGPPVAVPEKEGFGLGLIKGEVGYRLGGEVITAFDPAGLRVEVSFDLDA